MLDASAAREVGVDADAEIDGGFEASAALDLGTEVELDVELEVKPRFEEGAEDEPNLEYFGMDGCVEVENESAADFVLVGQGDVWLDCASSKRASYLSSARRFCPFFWPDVVVPPPSLRHMCARRHRLTYLTSRKLMAEIGAIYDQPKANREPDDAESADQKHAAIALSAH
jgi:hypothetical protein